MPAAIYAALFAFVVGTLIVPAGSQLVGRLIEMIGTALQRHGEALHDAYAGYTARWRTSSLPTAPAVGSPSHVAPSGGRIGAIGAVNE